MARPRKPSVKPNHQSVREYRQRQRQSGILEIQLRVSVKHADKLKEIARYLLEYQPAGFDLTVRDSRGRFTHIERL